MDSNKQSMFSIYNIAISQSLDCNLDCNLDYIKNNNDILTEFKNYYNCFDDEAIELIFEEIEKMSLKYSENHNIIWDRNFYKECLRIEKFFIVSREAREASDVDSVNDNENTKCNIFPQQRLFNNVTKRSMLPTHHNLQDVGPKYLA